LEGKAAELTNGTAGVGAREGVARLPFEAREVRSTEYQVTSHK
jgi:hypothetical protein